jgi:hypothetical protein
MKTSYHGYDVSTKAGQLDLFYGGRVDPNKSGKSSNAVTERDEELLKEHGVEGLEQRELFGVIDRLRKGGGDLNKKS